MTPESSIKKQICDYLNARGIWWTRMQAVNAKGADGRGWMRSGIVGMADLLCTPRAQGVVPLCVWIEVKTPNGRQSAEQIAFEKDVKERGHLYLLARDYTDVEALLSRHACTG